MDKVLKKYTTIPQHLYVNREADEQLKTIVDEMQRPGYVLVARQMGKTNLLFNAKRTLEHEGRLFVYVDLSNTFNLERDCYRNIVDSIIEPNESLFENIIEDLSNLRDKEFPPHKEYSKSLRIILNHFTGNIVIILDEIDALRSANYSDNIFAQIRSNYFSRTNFPVFERLTYILSGVIEPNELIKDRNKSPFNIGDKIYLDDFSLTEHNSFIKKSKLHISDDLSNHIYNWSNGNPRLTFDICSEIESFLLKSKKITKENIDLLINDKYLTSFDVAPIDHIRELVRSNKEIRNSLISIHRKQTTSLSDEIKRKLYLYGIVNSKFNETTCFKNKIIENSLSEEWIQSIDQKNKNLTVPYGLALADNEEYEDAIDTFEEILSQELHTDDELESINYFLGFSYYNLRVFDKAIDRFSYPYKEKTYIRNALSLSGSCNIALGKIKKGFDELEKVIKDQISDFAYHNALMNLAINLPNNQKERSISLLSDLYDSTFNCKDSKKNELNDLRTAALYYQAEIHFHENEILDSLDKLSKALEFASQPDSLYLKLSIYNLSTEKDENIKEDIVNTIISNKLIFNEIQKYPVNFIEEHLFKYLNLVFDPKNNTLFDRLINYALDNVYKNKTSKYSLIFSCSSQYSHKRESILLHLLKNESELSTDLLKRTYQDLALINSNNSKTFLAYFKKYQNIFDDLNTTTSNDIYLFAMAIKSCSDSKKTSDGLELCKIIEERLQTTDDQDLKFESLIIYYWYSSLHFNLNHNEQAIHYAEITLRLIKDSKKKNTSMIDEKGLMSIADQMNQIIKSSTIRKPVKAPKKYGRNQMVKVKYLDNTIIENKYKRLEADIKANKCKIISD